MTAAIAYTDINGQRYAAFPNTKLNNKDGTPKSLLDHVVNYTDSSNGAFRTLQLLDRLSKASMLSLRASGDSRASHFESASGKLSSAWAALSIPRLPSVTQAAFRAVSNWSQSAAGSVRDITQRVHDLADFASTWGYSGSWLTGSSSLRNAADLPDLLANVTELSMVRGDWSRAKADLKQINSQAPVTEAVSQRFADAVKGTFLKMLTKVISVAGGVLGLLALSFGGPVLPIPVLCGMGLTGTILAISHHFFKETRPYADLDFGKPPQMVDNVLAF